MFRERLGEILSPGVAIAKVADQGVQNLTAAGKIMLDWAGDETELIAERGKEMLPLPEAAGSVVNLLRDRMVTLLDLQKQFLEAAAEQSHEATESYKEGKGLVAVGASVAELARRGVENFVETEKKFLDLAVHEVKAARAEAAGRKVAPERYKVLTQLVREGGEKYIDAQQKLLNLAIEQMESTGKTAGKRVESVRNGVRTSWGELTEKSVHNFATAQKSLMELVSKPAQPKESTPERKAKATRARPRAPKEIAAHHKAA